MRQHPAALVRGVKDPRVTTDAVPATTRDEDRADPVTIFVCVTCRRAGDPEDFPRPGAALAAATARAAAGTGMTVTPVRCLANCSRGLSAAIRRHEGWTYMFGLLDAAADGAALVEGARLLATSGDGLLPWRGRPAPLKSGLIARVPPLDFTEDPP
jgi:predicted metal-binding protein